MGGTARCWVTACISSRHDRKTYARSLTRKPVERDVVMLAEVLGLGLLGDTFWFIVKPESRRLIPVALAVVTVEYISN